MGWMQLMSSKVGHLLPHSSDTAASHPGSHHRWPSHQTQTSQDDNVVLENERQHQHLRRTITEIDPRESSGGPDTSSLSAFLFSIFACSKAGVSCGDDLPIRQQPDEGKLEAVSASQAGTSTSSQNLQKSSSDNKVGEKRVNFGYGEHISGADMIMVSKSDIGNLVQTDSKDQVQKQANLKVVELASLSEPSLLLSEALQQSILPALPTLARGRQWTLLYSARKHGISLLTLYRKSSILPGPCLLVTGDNKGAVFGGLLSAPLRPTPKKKYQGTSETFVFTDVSGQPALYHSTGANRYYILCTNDALALGGGGHFALHLDDDLLTGSSGSCATFGNTPLANSEDFIVKDVELWGFSHSSRYSPRHPLIE